MPTIRLQTPSDQKARFKAFVICEAGSEISSLVEILRSLSISPLNVGIVESGVLNLSTSQTLISSSDFVIAVLRTANRPNVFFEIGYAIGRHRPVVIISDASVLPFDVMNMFWIKAPITDGAAIRFHIQRFVNNIDLVRKSSEQIDETDTETALKAELNKPNSVGLRGRDVSLFNLIRSLEQSGEIVSITTSDEESNDSASPDFAFWFRSSRIDGPVAVSVKRHLHASRSIERSALAFRSYCQNGDIPTGIILVKDEARPITVFNLYPLIFILDFTYAFSLTLSGSLATNLLAARNRFAHSAS